MIKILNCYFSTVRESFAKESPEEVSLEKDSIVFCYSEEINGWVFVKTMRGEKGYAPASYLNPLVLKFIERDTVHTRSSDIISSSALRRDLQGSVKVDLRSSGSGIYATSIWCFVSIFRSDLDRVYRRPISSTTQINQRRSIQRTISENDCIYQLINSYFS